VFFLPFLAQALTTLVSGRIADRVISTGLLSVVNTRRVFQLLGTGTSALVLLLLVFTPVDKTTAMIYMVSAFTERACLTRDRWWHSDFWALHLRATR
jgi:hypothetical protein